MKAKWSQFILTGTSVGLLALLLNLASGCGEKTATDPSKSAEKPGKESPPVSVKLAVPERHTVRQVIGQPGYIEAFDQTAVFTKIAGFVEKVYRDIGDPVTGPLYDAKDTDKKVQAGDLLAKLWVPEMV